MNDNEIISFLIQFSPALLGKLISNNEYEVPPHIEYLENQIIPAISKGNSKLIINLPPRHGKSEYISKYLPFWYLCNYPDKKIILASYGQEFASSWGGIVKELVNEFGKPIFGLSINPKISAKHNFSILKHKGGMFCTGAKGQLTGKGAHLFIIDDPIKNDAEAMSPKIRDNQWNWLKSTALTRLEPNGTMILLMTRWHDDDLCGRILREMPKDKWQIIKLPAISGDNDIIGREPNQPLWEKRYNLKSLLDLKQMLGTYWFESLFQQNPVAVNGSIFTRINFKYFDINGNFYLLGDSKNKLIDSKNLKFFATVDLAISTSTKADFTVIIHFAIDDEHNILICNVFRLKMESASHSKLISDFYQTYKPLIIGIESVQYQSSLIQTLLREGLPVKSLKPEKDKYSRALAMQSKHENGKIYFLRNAEWLYEFEKELLSFPYSEHDDQVDAFAYIDQLVAPISGNMPVTADIANRFKNSIANKFK